MSSDKNVKLKRSLGLFSLIGLCVGATVGAGIFSTISEVANVAQSSLFLVLAFFIGALMQIPGSFCYAELSSAYPVDGGHYVYFKEAGYKLITLLFGWLTFLAIDGPAVAIMSLSISNYLSFFIDADMIYLKLVSSLIVIVFTIMHIKSVKFGGITQAILTCIKIIPFVIICFFGAFFINPDLFLSHQSIDFSNDLVEFSNLAPLLCLVSAVAISSYSFDGLYAGSYISGELNNPKKVLPLGLISSAIIVMIIYVMLSSVSTGLLSIDAISSSKAPLADIVSKIPFFNNYVGIIVAVLSILVIMGTVSSCLLYMPRLIYAMSEDGLFFRTFSKLHKKYSTPYLSIILFSAYVIFLCFFSDLGNLLGSFTIMVLLKNLIVYLVIFKLRRKNNYKPSYRMPFGKFIPVLAIIFMSLLFVVSVVQSDVFALCFDFSVVALGIIAYYIFYYIKKRKSNL